MPQGLLGGVKSRPSSAKVRRFSRKGAGEGSGLARALSKLGYCSRSEARTLIAAGRVRVNGVTERDPERRVRQGRDRIEVNGETVRADTRVYLMLNKPRGLITTASDEQGRETVFQCLAGFQSPNSQETSERSSAVPPERPASLVSIGGVPRSILPRVFPVGRLDKASEGLLLFTNDTVWAGRITDPASHLDKTYHVQVDCLADDSLADRLLNGATAEGEFLSVKRASVLRRGDKNSWLEIVLDEGRNRHIRRLLATLGVRVLRLVRIAIGPLPLGVLAKGGWRHLTRTEVAALALIRDADRQTRK